MLRVLQSVSFLHRAGLETMLMNYYRHIDRDRVQFDFLINKDIRGAYEEEAMELGARMFRTPGFNPAKSRKYNAYMKQLFAGNPEIKIVHGHNDMEYVPLKCAKEAGIKTRIAHSHNTRLDKGIKYPLKEYCRRHIKDVANQYWGCSLAAIEFYYGKEVVESGNYVFLKNAIELERFKFNEDVRKNIRDKHSLGDALVIGHVGRFTYQKNHEKLLDIFKCIHDKENNSFLVLIGEGELEEDIKNKAAKLNILDRIIFTGAIDNVNEYYQAMDAFVMPSRYEGLPVVGIEAQASGVLCVFSDAVTCETKVSANAAFYPLEETPDKWANFIMEMITDYTRTDSSDMLTQAGYNIEVEAKRLMDLYLELAGED